MTRSNKVSKKRIRLYYLILFSIFILNTITFIEPAMGYSLGVPDLAKGAETESVVEIYDKGEWENHLGSEADGPDEVFLGDADEVGAKEKSKVIEWEEGKEKIEFLKDYILQEDTEVEGAPDIEVFDDVFDYINENIKGLVDPLGDSNAILAVYGAVQSESIFNDAPEGTYEWEVFNISEIVLDACLEYAIDKAYIHEKYDEKFDGTILLRDYWEFTSAEYTQKPDEKDFEVPIFKNPGDWYENYKDLKELKTELLTEVNYVIDIIEEFDTSIALLKALSYANWTTLNDTVKIALDATSTYVPSIAEGGDDLPRVLLDATLNPTGLNPLQEGRTGLLSVEPNLDESIPGKFGFLYNLLTEGLPVYTPVDKYLKEVVSEFDIDEEDIETAIPGLNPEVAVRGEVEAEGNTLTLKFRYPEDTVDPDDPEEELEDFEIQFIYSDMGFQEAVIYKDGDDIFYKKVSKTENMKLFGYPVYQLLMAAGSISGGIIVGIISVILKRKNKKLVGV